MSYIDQLIRLIGFYKQTRGAQSPWQLSASFFLRNENFPAPFFFTTKNMSGDNNDQDSEEDKSRPATPTNDDCCGNSCNPCIFDVHKKMLKQWEERKLRGNRGYQENNFLNPLCYKIFVVDYLVEVAENFVKIRLGCKRHIDRDSRLILKPGQHVILSIGNKKSRPYTPIFWTRDSLELLIKIYPGGFFSRDFERLKIDDEIGVRGPYGDFHYKRNSFRQIVAFCIGSGIAAIYPIARSIVEDEFDETRIDLVAGFRKIGQIPLKKELRQLSDYWNVTCTLHISSPICDEIHPSGPEIRQGRLTENTIDQLLVNHSSEKTLILVCGTREFNESLENWIKERGFINYHVFS